MKCFLISRLFAQNGNPGQAGLLAVQATICKEFLGNPARATPNRVMIGNIKRVIATRDIGRHSNGRDAGQDWTWLGDLNVNRLR